MSDLSRLVEDACAWLEGSETAPLSGSPETLSGRENQQASDDANSFRSFHSFRSGNEPTGDINLIGSETSLFSVNGSRASGFYEEVPERTETPERGRETPAGSTPPLFPVRDKEPERPEREVEACGRPSLDLNTAAPQRSDWWSGPAMAEADRLASPAEPLPISPDDVRAGISRELHALADLGLSDAAALVRAVEITAGKIRNSPVLIERQIHAGQCHACNGPLDDTRPMVAVLQAKGGSPLWLHHGACCLEHSRRRAALVSKIMRAAGYGAEAEGEAA